MAQHCKVALYLVSLRRSSTKSTHRRCLIRLRLVYLLVIIIAQYLNNTSQQLAACLSDKSLLLEQNDRALWCYDQTLPKAQWTRGLRSAYQNNFFCHIKVLAFHLQNIDQASTSKSQPYLSISTQLKLQNLNQT